MVSGRINSSFPTDGTKLMKPKLDLVSMLLGNVNGRSPVLDIKKRKAKEGFAGVRPAENTLMLKVRRMMPGFYTYSHPRLGCG